MRKPIRTEDNKPSQSSPIRKGSMSKEQIKQEAEKLTKCPEIIEEVEAPAIEPVVKGDYEVYAAGIKEICKRQDTVEVATRRLKEYFPQNKDVSDIVRNLKRGHGINYRRLENGNYLLFVEPTREQLIVQLTSAESKVIELQKEYQEAYNRLGNNLQELGEENENLRKEIKRQSFWIDIITSLCIVCLLAGVAAVHYGK